MNIYYKIKKYSTNSGCHYVISLDGRQNGHWVDLFVNSSFNETPLNDQMTKEEMDDTCKKMVGDTVLIEDLLPIQFAAKNVTWFKSDPISTNKK